MNIADDKLAALLVANSVVEEAKLKEVEAQAKEQHVALSALLVEKGLLTDEQLGLLIADSLKVPYIKLAKVTIPKEVLAIIPESVARKQNIIAFARDGDTVKVAAVDPTDVQMKAFIEKKTGSRVEISFATEKDIHDALNLYKEKLQESFNTLLVQQVAVAGKSAPKDAPVGKIVDLLIAYAYQDRASDIHIEPEDKDSLVRFRIDGVLHDVLRLPRILHEQIITRIKVLSRLRTDEHLSAQDGKIRFPIEEEELDIRVSIVPIVDGEKVVLRLLSSRMREIALSELGMSEKDLAKVTAGFRSPYGMVLATGPTGSGKTTTIYAMLMVINSREQNIATIEDPVEYDIAGINQIQVNPKTNLTFANGLRSILRQDPNIIFVGEVRDDETAGIAVNSAMTGHLVLSTLHTNDAGGALPRLINMHIEPFLVASTVNVIIAQRLVRKLCEKCRFSVTPKLEDLAKHMPKTMIEKHFSGKTGLLFYQAKGCSVCHSTGYSGRVGIFEVLEVTKGIKELIVAKEDSDVITRRAIEEGMTTMFDDGLDKVESGITSIEEILRATRLEEEK